MKNKERGRERNFKKVAHITVVVVVVAKSCPSFS